MTITKSSCVDKLLQNGLEIDSEGRCVRHPEILLCCKEKGEIISCDICTAEQEQMQDESSQVVDAPSRQSQETHSGLSISKMVTSIPPPAHKVPTTVNAIRKNGFHENNKNDEGDNDNDENNNNNNEINTASPTETEFEQEEDGSTENLIARWCQLQDATSKPSNDTLSSTLIMLQLQKLERRVQQQEVSIQNLSDNLTQQQSSIQNDLSRILSYMAVSASHAQNAHHQQLMVPNTSYHTSVAGGPTAAGSAVSALSNETQSTSTSYHHRQAAPPGGREIVVSPPPMANPRQRSLTNSLHPSSVFTSVRTLERQPPRPPKRHDSFRSLGQSLGRKSTGVSSGDLSNSSKITSSSSAFDPQQLQLQQQHPQQQTAATSVSEQPTSVLSPISKPMVTDPQVNLTKSKSKSSFRNSQPQLDVIWDASDHTSGHHSPNRVNAKVQPQNSNSANTTTTNNNGNSNDNGNNNNTITITTNTNNNNNNSKSNTPSKNPALLRFNKAKRAPPKLATLSLDDDDDDDDVSTDRSAKLFSGMKTYIELGKQNGDPLNASGVMPPLMNHDSVLTGVQSFMDDTVESNTVDLNATNTVETSIQDSIPATISELQVSTVDTETTNNDADDDDTSSVCSSSKSGGNLKSEKKNKKESKKSKKDKKKKKESKKSKKDKKKDGRGSILNNKVSPSEGKEHRKRGRFSTTKIFWKRSTKSLTASGSEASANSPTMPQRQTSAGTRTTAPGPPEFSVFNDNPRTHLMPTPSTMDLGPMSPPTSFKKPAVQRKHTDMTTKISNTGTSTTDAEETMTVKTPMTAKTPNTAKTPTSAKTPLTAKTPMTAKTPLDAVQKYSAYMDAPPPPTQEKRYRSDLHPPTLKSGHKNTPNDSHPPSPPPRRRAPFPRTRGMMPTLVNSKREIVVGDSIKQISTLTLDTALPSADAGSVLQEVTHQTITDKCKERGTYTGTVNENEEPDGYGTMIYNSGAFYKGHWKEGHWHGNGILRTPNGDSYEGDFVYDCRHGRGIYKYENGDVYEGDFSSDKRHGKGTFLFQSGSMYRGDFAYGNFHGYGWYEFEEGYYEGSWAEGVYEGIGSLIYKDGSHYTGRFKAGAADGMGEEKQADGTSKRGMWRNGEFIGQIEQLHPEEQSNPHDSVLSV